MKFIWFSFLNLAKNIYPRFYWISKNTKQLPVIKQLWQKACWGTTKLRIHIKEKRRINIYISKKYSKFQYAIQNKVIHSQSYQLVTCNIVMHIRWELVRKIESDPESCSQAEFCLTWKLYLPQLLRFLYYKTSM